MTESGDDAGAHVARMIGKDAFSRWLGVELVSLAPGACTLRMMVRRDMINGFDVAHGGIVFSLADSAMAFACNGGPEVTVAVDNSISYPAAVRVGDELVARAVEERSTSRLAFYAVTVRRSADDAIVALFRGTVYRTAQRHDATDP
ncbi:MAG: hydroxyphenylacetyl-CoA thioesterase PaaI [Gemmatimonadaceae bacterium]|nr:hydroxyphenylacetyl-CoA thioesterase PaaI [Gemmatimonadaceae bacterium]